MAFFRSIVPTLAVMALLTACGGTPTGTGDDRVILTNPSFLTDIQEIFVRRGCTASNCHGSAMSGGLGLASAAASYADLVDVAATAVDGPSGLDRVTANNTAASYLWLKVSGSTAGARMPQGLAVLDATDLGNIENWINTGALNN
jgi:hypothetical protein